MVALVACGAPGDGAGPGETHAPGRVRGTVVVGPPCPAERSNGDCERPVATLVQITLLDGTPVEQVRSGRDGTFEVGLPPGTYVFHVGDLRGAMLSTPETVKVEAGRLSEVRLVLDRIGHPDRP